MDLGLRREEVAKRLGVIPMTVRLWENGKVRPGIRKMARVIDFLGFDPTPPEASLPARLHAYRRLEGLTQRELAARLGVPRHVASRWEWRREPPDGEHWATINRVLGLPQAEPSDLPNRLRQLRRRLGLTRADLGRRLGVDQWSVANWESGMCEPLPARRARVERLLAQLDA
jgi:transcriptional regulator with XRE-family HTH domain